MATAKSRAISAILIISMVIGMVGIFNTDTTYAAKKKIHLNVSRLLWWMIRGSNAILVHPGNRSNR